MAVKSPLVIPGIINRWSCPLDHSRVLGCIVDCVGVCVSAGGFAIVFKFPKKAPIDPWRLDESIMFILDCAIKGNV